MRDGTTPDHSVASLFYTSLLRSPLIIRPISSPINRHSFTPILSFISTQIVYTPRARFSSQPLAPNKLFLISSEPQFDADNAAFPQVIIALRSHTRSSIVQIHDLDSLTPNMCHIYYGIRIVYPGSLVKNNLLFTIPIDYFYCITRSDSSVLTLMYR